MPNSQSISGRVRNLANLSKPDVQIHFAGDAENGRSYINSFTTGDELKGNLSVTAPHDTQYDHLEISLVGSTKCYVDRISPSASISARSEAFQMFLKMDCPVPEVPGNGVLKAGHTYKVPYTFVVPSSLPGSCKHKTINESVKELHLRLPPSLGDPEMAGRGSQLMDDCAPDMCRISYVIRVRFLRFREGEGKNIIVADRSRKVRILPAYIEQPPISVDESDEDYCLRAEKSVKKSLLKSKSGKLVMEASQPKSLHLAAPNKPTEKEPTTMASVQLRFDPLSETAEPPKLGQLASKLRVGTFFASTPRVKLPTGKAALTDNTQGLYVDVLNLSARCLSGMNWTKHDPHTSSNAANLRRDSALSIGMGASGECPAPTSIYQSNLPFYTAQLLVPIFPPKNKILVPSFQSCLSSRVYILEVSLNLPQTSNITLKLPIQVTSEGGEVPPPDFEDYPQQELELEDIDALDQYLSPRRTSSTVDSASSEEAPRRTSPPRRQNPSIAPPPEYSSFAPRSGGLMRSEGTPALYHALNMVR